MYVRPVSVLIHQRLSEPRRFIQVIVGPRQVGKTTCILAVLSGHAGAHRYFSCDDPGVHDRIWLEQQWELGRRIARENGDCVIVIDEIQKIPGWSETVKRLWDEDAVSNSSVKAVLLGSSSMLLHKGLGESLAGRFELIRMPHWSFGEMRAGFGWDVETYITYGGYPGAASLISDQARWCAYVLDSLVEATISRDVLQMERVDKPALLRQLFDLGCAYSGQIVSYQKLVGQLQDAGNTTTLAHYLRLLEHCGLLQGISKYSPAMLRTRGSSPRLQVLDTALFTVQHLAARERMRDDPSLWGRAVESAAGAHLCNSTAGTPVRVYYWRERDREVDFVLQRGERLLAVEVKSSRRRERLPGVSVFMKRHQSCRSLLVGGDGMPLEEFLSTEPETLV